MDEGDDAQKKLQDALDSDPDNPSHHFDLGIHLWSRGEEEGARQLKEKAVVHFVAAAKLDPSNGAAFRYLGHYYSSVSLESLRAAKCYQRAVALDPDDFESGERLCDLLDGEGKESLEVSVCREASERSPRAFWAFRRLGYLKVHHGEWQEAVQRLQHAIRGYPACADLWEALGLAYQRLGMLTAAIKSYERAFELDELKIFALIESGNIHLMLGSFRKGVEQFRRSLEISPDNLSARFGLASALLGLSEECKMSGAFDWGASLLKEASDVAKACADSAGNFYSTWKLHGDIQIAYAQCFPWYNEDAGTEIDEKIFETSINSWKKTCHSSAINAKHSYQRALHLFPWQANAYSDVAISLNLIYSFEEKSVADLSHWNLPEKMSLGGLLLEGENKNIWVVLGFLSNNNALKQHAFVRGLQLDASLSVAWAYLGKLYRQLGEHFLAKQAFDHARSIDPSLSLPWASMSVDTSVRKFSKEEAYESCLRAAQILPLADFQLGLGALAKVSGHLLSPQVFGAVQQAVQRAPFYPESHNLNGLVCEVRSDFQSAITSYRRAKCALSLSSSSELKSQFVDVSINLARSLCQAGDNYEAVRECEELKNRGFLDSNSLQIYAVALWQLGENDLALIEARKLAAEVSSMDKKSGAAALGLICKLVYCISGIGPTVATISRIPRELLQNSKLSLVIHAICAIEPSSGLQFVPGDITGQPHKEACEMHYIVGLGKMFSNDSNKNMGTLMTVNYLKKALHMLPDSTLLRNQMSTLLLSCKDWMASHNALRCVVVPAEHLESKCSKSSYEIIGAASVACYASCVSEQNRSFPTCKYHISPRLLGLRHLQRWLHQEPWNHRAYYLLVLNVVQRAREEKFPRHLCAALKRLLFVALSKEIYSIENQFYQYERFQLLLCASEICLQYREYNTCLAYAINASELHLSMSSLFFAHLQLCRVHAAVEDLQNLSKEYIQCLNLKTDSEIGWISLSYFGYKYKLQDCLKSGGSDGGQFPLLKEFSSNKWEAIFYLALSQSFLWDLNFVNAEQALSHALSMGNADRCLLLCHGAICMELARRQCGQYLSPGIRSLTKAQRSVHPLPIVSALRAQAEASLGSRAQWVKNLRAEWFSWPPETRPAELYFQMHLLAKEPNSSRDKYPNVEFSQSPERWILRALHLNPSCSRYWKILQKLTEL